MTKNDLVTVIAHDADISKASAKRALESAFDNLGKALVDGGAFTLKGFGTFSVTQRGERKGRNPQTGADITIPASKAVKFKQGKALKAELNKV